MEWFTYIAYGMIPILFFAATGLIIIRITIRLLIDSWATARNKISYHKELQLMEETATRGRRF